MSDEVKLVVEPVKKSQLFDVFFQKLPYPLASALVRGIKVALAIILPALITAVADGTLIPTIHFIPAGYVPLVTALVSPILISLEKYFREQGLLDEAKQIPTSIAGNGPEDTDTLAEPPEDIPTL
jgi:hypothetical protein